MVLRQMFEPSEEDKEKSAKRVSMILAMLTIAEQNDNNSNAFVSSMMDIVMLLTKVCRAWYDSDPVAFRIWWPSVVESVEASLEAKGIKSPLKERLSKGMVDVPTDEEIKEMLKKANAK